MPTHSRIHRAEAKYNVTTEFPHLGLHAAAATGNVGLVKYALSHGQPVNSVLDGVLPLHAACSGGNDFVVRLLIEQGADVNAPRLPRRYSDRSRDTAAPIVGTSGSTPLHFAAANGHSMVIRTLLLNGAHADQPDKHGVTPQTLARQNGWVECADVLQEWLANQERSLRERGESPASGEAQQFRGRSSSSGAMECIETSIRKRLHLKRSIDHALNVLRPSGTPDPEINPLPMQISLSEDFSSNHAHSSSLEQYALHNASPSFPEDSSSPRRPSFPHVFDESLRRPSTSSLHTRVSRPRSAGTGAESAPPIRKLNSKLSLLSLFKKSNADGSSSSVTSEHNSSASSIPLPTPSPASGSIPLPVSPRSITAPLSSSPKDFPSIEQHRRRIGSNSSARSHLPIAMELYPGQQLRNRSASGGSRASMTPNEDLQSEAASPPIRPGILRLHNRSSSSGQSQSQTSMPQSSSRIIRFDPSSSTSSLSGRTRSPGSRYVGTNQTLETRYRSNTLEAAEERFGIAPSTPIEEHPIMLDPQPPNSAPPIVVGMADDDVDDDAEDFGVPINRQTDSQRPEEPRGRKVSASLSPPLLQSSKPLHVHNSDFPFNINEPPPSDDITAMHPSHESPRQPENRLRGESVSSTSTDSNNPQSSGSSVTWTSNGGSVTTPNTPYLSLSSPYIASNNLGRSGPDSPRSPKPPMSPGRQVNSPIEIDIHSISSHAQAEELVHRTQQSILSMDNFVVDVPKPNGAGRTLLSSKLLAYGESLAIERRLKEQEDAKTSLSIPSPSIDQFSAGRTPTSGYDSTQFIKGHSARAMSRSQSAGKLRVGSRGSSGSDSSSETASRSFVVPRLRRPSRSASDELHSMDRPTGQVFSSGNAFLAPRSRTPDPESSPLEMEGPIMHVPLSRVATAPVQVSLSAHIPSRRGSDQAKHIMSANKLTRMGFSTSDGWQPPPSGGSTRPPTKHKFGGIRTLMQTFQGK